MTTGTLTLTQKEAADYLEALEQLTSSWYFERRHEGRRLLPSRLHDHNRLRDLIQKLLPIAHPGGRKFAKADKEDAA